jgi:hypothetical protein
LSLPENRQAAADGIRPVTGILALTLVLQLAAILACHLRLGRTWLRRPGVLLILTAVVYGGVFPAADDYPRRPGLGHLPPGHRTAVRR